MPYKTPGGKHYHETIGCHGATIPCSTEGLEPCRSCCGRGVSGGAAATGAQGGGTATATTGASGAFVAASATASDAAETGGPVEGVTSEEVAERLRRLQGTLEEPLSSLPMPQGLDGTGIASLTDEEATEVLRIASLMTYEASKVISNSRRKMVTEQYAGLSERGKGVIDSIPAQERQRAVGKAANKYRGEIYEILIAHSGESYDAGSEAAAELSEKLGEYRGATGEEFPSGMLAQMTEDADEARRILESALPGISSVSRVGNETKNQDGDLLVTMDDGRELMVEVKRASGGLGTYLNTSIDNAVSSLAEPVPGTDMSRFEAACGGRYETMPSYTQFLDDSGYRDELRGIVGADRVSPKGTASFVTDRAAEKSIRGDKATYDAVKAAVARHTAHYRDMFYAYLLDTDQVESFSRACIGKTLSGKSAPDLLVSTDVGGAKAKTRIISPMDLLDGGVDDSAEKQGDVSIGFKSFHMTFAWQNGTGLRNSTMRVFLDHGAVGSDGDGGSDE